MKFQMQKLLRSTWFRWVLFLGLCALSLGLCKLTLFDSYDRFIEQEKQVRPLFVALNDTVFASIPPPEGVVEVERGAVGGWGGTGHGVALFVDYENNDVSSDSIWSYYNEMLVSNGWEEYQKEFGGPTTRYYRDTSCVDINIFEKSYYIEIFHDLLGQEFSPKMPPLWLLRLHEYGETSVVRCPPVPDDW